MFYYFPNKYFKQSLMKLATLFISLFFISSFGFSQKYRFEQNFKQSELEEFKKAKVFIGLTDDDEINKALREAVNNNWDFTQIEGEETIESIKKRASEGDNVAFIGMVETGSSNLFSSRTGVRAKSKSYALQVNVNGTRYGFYHQHLCYAEGFVDSINLSVDLGVKILNSKLKAIDQEKYKRAKDLKKYAQAQKSVFDKKTLYIPREWLDDITEEEFKQGYNRKVKFVDLEEYVYNIKTGNQDMIYALPIAVPAEGGFVNTHIFIDADGHKYLGLCQRLTMSEMASNIFNDYSGVIEKQHIRLYDNTSNGKW